MYFVTVMLSLRKIRIKKLPIVRARRAYNTFIQYVKEGNLGMFKKHIAGANRSDLHLHTRQIDSVTRVHNEKIACLILISLMAGTVSIAPFIMPGMVNPIIYPIGFGFTWYTGVCIRRRFIQQKMKKIIQEMLKKE